MFWMMLGCALDAPADPAITETRLFEVPAGATARGLGSALAEAGLISAEWKWTWYLRMGADGTCIKAGRHAVSPAMAFGQLLESLCGAPVPKDEPFTVVEGWRIREIDAALTEKGWIKAGEYALAAASAEGYTVSFPLPKGPLEGYLYPETYRVEPDGFAAKAFVQRQLDTFAARFYTGHEAELGSRTLSDVVIMASMIEREEPTAANRPLVAGVLWKRIGAGWHLGVDATSRYTLEDWNDRKAFLTKLRDPNDPYNSRLRPGLPPTAIGNPGATALAAALHPTESEYWYYLHDSAQVLHPSRNVAEHEAYRKKYNVY